MSSKKEIWKPITIDGRKPTVPYMISNHGRFGVSVNGKIEVRQFKPTAGNYRYNTRQQGKNKAIFLYKEVAKAFLKKPSSKHAFIIHKDHNYLNDHVDNLKWATQDEHRTHTAFSPRSIQARERKAISTSVHSKVLNERKVAALKKMIWDPKRKLSFKKIAEKFGVSEMQIYRIKTGEFWYHVRVENEPLHAKYKKNLSNLAFQEKREAKENAAKEKRKSATARSRSQKGKSRKSAPTKRNKKPFAKASGKRKR
jgi:anti-sigma28 factor (negative regulator of flagellin synthesis)